VTRLARLKEAKIVCPKCGESEVENFEYLFSTPVKTPVLEVKETPQIVDGKEVTAYLLSIPLTYEPDDGAEQDEGRLKCNCGEVFDLPENLYVYYRG